MMRMEIGVKGKKIIGCAAGSKKLKEPECILLLLYRKAEISFY